MLDVEDLHVTYGGAVCALQGVTLTVPDGKVAALLGSNGAGKSTLLRCVSGTLRIHRGAVNSGTVLLDGKSLLKRDAAVIVKSGVVQVPEGRRIFGCLTVEENLRAGSLGNANRSARKNLLRGRPGWAMQMVRDSEIAAAVMGVDVRRYKASAFVLSSMYAGLAGVLFALTYTRIVPNTFDFDLSIQFLAMIIIGGLGSVGGAALGAILVIALPQLLTLYGSGLPFLAAPGSGGVDPGTFAKYVFGAAIIGFLLFESGGLAAIGARIAAPFYRRADRARTPRVDAPPDPPVATGSSSTTDPPPSGSPSNSA